jgi:2-polyprenyl-3-methyl-5-hydroxy-6-metoxy-1,4-benzoquinol methylase
MCKLKKSENGYTDFFYERNKLDKEMANQYRIIAESDLVQEIQESIYLEKKALLDLDRIGEIEIGSNVLEIGPGSGVLSKKLSELPINLFCVDLTDKYWSGSIFQSEKIRCFLADAQELPFVSSFDLIILTDVLEHVLRPADVLYSVARALKLGGQVYVRTPSNEVLAPYGLLRGANFPSIHLRTYTKKTLRRELVAAGLNVGTDIGYETQINWRFASDLNVYLRDLFLSVSPRPKIFGISYNIEFISKIIYGLSQNKLFSKLLSTPIELWALAKLSKNIEPKSFTEADINYLGLVLLEGKTDD